MGSKDAWYASAYATVRTCKHVPVSPSGAKRDVTERAQPSHVFVIVARGAIFWTQF